MYAYIDTYSIKIYAIAYIYTIRRSVSNELSQESCASNFRRLNFVKEQLCIYTYVCVYIRGELSYLAPLGSENISAPYFKQYFFQGGITPRLSQTPRLPVPR
jgi:hypothetical protein